MYFQANSYELFGEKRMACSVILVDYCAGKYSAWSPAVRIFPEKSNFASMPFFSNTVFVQLKKEK